MAAVLFFLLLIPYPITYGEQAVRRGEEEEKRMARQTSKGTCTFCHKELSKASMIRHLQSCEQPIEMQNEIGSRQRVKKSKAFHLMVEGYRLPMYWMHLEVAAGTTLATLDRFFEGYMAGVLRAFECL